MWIGTCSETLQKLQLLIPSHILELCMGALGILFRRFGAMFGLVHYVGIKYMLLTLTGV